MFKYATIILTAACGLQAGIITIISQGTTPGTWSQGLQGPGAFTTYADVGWTTGATPYSNVTIQALLRGDDVVNTVDAYLTTAIGTGTTTANEVARTLGISVASGSFNQVTLFTGLNLAASTSYFLTLAPGGSTHLTWGIDDSQPSPVTASGVSIIPAGWCNMDGFDCASYPPASGPLTLSGGVPVNPLGANPIFSVVANDSSVPEPASAALLAGGLGLVILARRRRR